jgi:hypothetical protein
VTLANSGTLFALTPRAGSAARLMTLHRFLDDYEDGHTPNGPLLLAADGHLYGTTRNGGGIFRQKIR